MANLQEQDVVLFVLRLSVPVWAGREPPVDVHSVEVVIFEKLQQVSRKVAPPAAVCGHVGERFASVVPASKGDQCFHEEELLLDGREVFVICNSENVTKRVMSFNMRNKEADSPSG